MGLLALEPCPASFYSLLMVYVTVDWLAGASLSGVD
jgi:hypothetical protein